MAADGDGGKGGGGGVSGGLNQIREQKSGQVLSKYSGALKKYRGNFKTTKPSKLNTRLKKKQCKMM